MEARFQKSFGTHDGIFGNLTSKLQAHNIRRFSSRESCSNSGASERVQVDFLHCLVIVRGDVKTFRLIFVENAEQGIHAISIIAAFASLCLAHEIQESHMGMVSTK